MTRRGVNEDLLAKYPTLRGRPEEMAMMCKLLRDRAVLPDALALGEAAVAAAPESLAVSMAVRSALGDGVPGFHRPMMLDGRRNRAYARAIERAVRPGMLVLEIGCGAGLLAMIAARAGARVITCEGNPMVAAAAEEIVRRNGLSDRIRVIAKLSNKLTIPEDLPEPADLVIHEIFGAQLFDEGVTASLTDARKRLLKPGAPSIPGQARVRCALLRDVRERETRTLENVEGFDLSLFECLQPRRQWLRKRDLSDQEVCSDFASGLQMDYDRQPPFGPASETISLISHGGRVDALAQWISIDLGAGDVYENPPGEDGEKSHWGVLVHQFPTPIETRAGDRIDVTMRHRGTLLTIDAALRAPG